MRPTDETPLEIPDDDSHVHSRTADEVIYYRIAMDADCPNPECEGFELSGKLDSRDTRPNVFCRKCGWHGDNAQEMGPPND